MLPSDCQRLENQHVVTIEKCAFPLKVPGNFSPSAATPRMTFTKVKHKHWSQRVAAKRNMTLIKQILNDYKSTNSTSKQKTDRTAKMNRGMEATQTRQQRLVGAWHQPYVLAVHLKSCTKQLWNITTATGIIRNKRKKKTQLLVSRLTAASSCMVEKEREKVSGPLNETRPVIHWREHRHHVSATCTA